MVSTLTSQQKGSGSNLLANWYLSVWSLHVLWILPHRCSKELYPAHILLLESVTRTPSVSLLCLQCSMWSGLVWSGLVVSPAVFGIHARGGVARRVDVWPSQSGSSRRASDSLSSLSARL